MSEIAEKNASTSSPVAAGEKKVKKSGGGAAAKPKVKPNHPPTAEMVDAAIGTLKERGGSSVMAIKKYVAATYKVDVEKLAPFIKKYIKGAVVKGHLLQTKGKGATGSFKLSTAKKPSTTPKKPKKTPEKGKSKKADGEKKKVTKKQAVAGEKKAVKTKKTAAAVKPKKVVAVSPKKTKTALKVKKPTNKKVSAKK